MRLLKNNRFSGSALMICMLLILVSGVIYYPKWKQSHTEATISWDVSGYYMYLPAIFIYKDIKNCSFRDYVIENYQPSPQFDQAYLHASGNYVMKYSSGQALLLSPFFFAAHFIANHSNDYLADGFSFPYQLAIGIGALLYAFIGLIVLRKVLLHYFSDRPTAFTLIAIVFGSNYLNYAAIDGAMTHNTLFTVYALLLYTTIRFYKAPGYLNAAVIGGLAGLATLIRPTEIISVLIPLLWGISNKKDFKERMYFFRRHWQYLLLSALLMLILISIQLIYWKYVTGDWIVYSYQNEGFSFLKPHIIDCMLSYRSGWLLYSPIMLLSILGFIFLYKRHRKLFLPALIFSLLFTYICFSWDVWWYGGSLGQRAMVQSYPVLAFPMAAFISAVLSSKTIYKVLLFCFTGFCIWYNLWLTHQAHKGGLFVPGQMTKAYFHAILGKNNVDVRVKTLLDNNVMFNEDPANPVIVYTNEFENERGNHVTAIESMEGHSIFLDKQHQFSNEYSFTLPSGNKKRLRATAEFYAPEKEWDTWKMTQFIIKFYEKEKLVQTNQVRVYRILNEGTIQNIALDAKIPDRHFDRVAVLFWNAGGSKKILIDNLKVIIF